MVIEVDDQVAVLQATRSFRRRSGGAAEGGLDPGEELREAQRLGDVIVRAKLQPADFVGLGAAGGDEQDRDPAELADPLEDLPAIEARQGHVEDDEIGVMVVELAERLRPRGGTDGLIPSVRDP